MLGIRDMVDEFEDVGAIWCMWSAYMVMARWHFDNS